MRSLYIILIAALILPVSGSAWAQAPEETPWYTIEMFLFARGGSAGVTEQWPVDPGTPDIDNVAVLQPPQTVLEGVVEPYSEAPREEWQLAAEFRRIAKTGGRLQPLLHTAWRQPVVNKASTRPLYLTMSNEANKVEGVIQVSVQRYLHVDLDLVLSDPNVIPAQLQASDTDIDTLQSRPSQYRLKAHRKMRSEELHYIDHPKMGVVILATKFDIPTEEPPTEEPETSQSGSPTEAAEETAAAEQTNATEGATNTSQ